MNSPLMSRRAMLLGGVGLVGAGTLAACTTGPSHAEMDMGTTRGIGPVPSVSPSAGQKVVTGSVTARATTLDLGGATVKTWAYGDSVPGPLFRATAGDFLRITVDNQLPADTTVHWHGLRLRNAADGVPGVTQDPITPGTKYVYEFTAPDPGTYFFHPHVGVQLDRGLYAPLVIDDPHETGRYDDEWVVVLDDWIDGTGTTPDDVLAKLVADGGTSSTGMSGMDHGSMSPTGSGSSSTGSMGMGAMSMNAPPWGDAGDVTYPHHLINGKTPTDPATFRGKPGQKIRIRFINAAADTIYTVALGGHRMTITHTDGHPVRPAEVGALYLGMGERYDATVTLGDGAFPLVAAPFGKSGHASAVVRTATGGTPSSLPAELTGAVLIGSTLTPTDAARLPRRDPDATANLSLNGTMRPYQWAINGAPYGKNTPLTVTAGQRLRINVTNMTMMTHPLHLHGHTFALADTGLRKDTLLLAPMETRAIDLDADNTGDWMVHCHNVYHAEAGMMILLNYTR